MSTRNWDNDWSIRIGRIIILHFHPNNLVLNLLNLKFDKKQLILCLKRAKCGALLLVLLSCSCRAHSPSFHSFHPWETVTGKELNSSGIQALKAQFIPLSFNCLFFFKQEICNTRKFASWEIFVDDKYQLEACWASQGNVKMFPKLGSLSKFSSTFRNVIINRCAWGENVGTVCNCKFLWGRHRQQTFVL